MFFLRELFKFGSSSRSNPENSEETPTFETLEGNSDRSRKRSLRKVHRDAGFEESRRCRHGKHTRTEAGIHHTPSMKLLFKCNGKENQSLSKVRGKRKHLEGKRQEDSVDLRDLDFDDLSKLYYSDFSNPKATLNKRHTDHKIQTTQDRNQQMVYVLQVGRRKHDYRKRPPHLNQTVSRNKMVEKIFQKKDFISDATEEKELEVGSSFCSESLNDSSEETYSSHTSEEAKSSPVTNYSYPLQQKHMTNPMKLKKNECEERKTQEINRRERKCLEYKGYQYKCRGKYPLYCRNESRKEYEARKRGFHDDCRSYMKKHNKQSLTSQEYSIEEVEEEGEEIQEEEEETIIEEEEEKENKSDEVKRDITIDKKLVIIKQPNNFHKLKKCSEAGSYKHKKLEYLLMPTHKKGARGIRYGPRFRSRRLENHIRHKQKYLASCSTSTSITSEEEIKRERYAQLSGPNRKKEASEIYRSSRKNKQAARKREEKNIRERTTEREQKSLQQSSKSSRSSREKYYIKCERILGGGDVKNVVPNIVSDRKIKRKKRQSKLVEKTKKHVKVNLKCSHQRPFDFLEERSNFNVGQFSTGAPVSFQKYDLKSEPEKETECNNIEKGIGEPTTLAMEFREKECDNHANKADHLCLYNVAEQLHDSPKVNSILTYITGVEEKGKKMLDQKTDSSCTKKLEVVNRKRSREATSASVMSKGLPEFFEKLHSSTMEKSAKEFANVKEIENYQTSSKYNNDQDIIKHESFTTNIKIDEDEQLKLENLVHFGLTKKRQNRNPRRKGSIQKDNDDMFKTNDLTVQYVLKNKKRGRIDTTETVIGTSISYEKINSPPNTLLSNTNNQERVSLERNNSKFRESLNAFLFDNTNKDKSKRERNTKLFKMLEDVLGKRNDKHSKLKRGEKLSAISLVLTKKEKTHYKELRESVLKLHRIRPNVASQRNIKFNKSSLGRRRTRGNGHIIKKLQTNKITKPRLVISVLPSLEIAPSRSSKCQKKKGDSLNTEILDRNRNNGNRRSKSTESGRYCKDSNNMKERTKLEHFEADYELMRQVNTDILSENFDKPSSTKSCRSSGRGRDNISYNATAYKEETNIKDVYPRFNLKPWFKGIARGMNKPKLTFNKTSAVREEEVDKSSFVNNCISTEQMSSRENEGVKVDYNFGLAPNAKTNSRKRRRDQIHLETFPSVTNAYVKQEIKELLPASTMTTSTDTKTDVFDCSCDTLQMPVTDSEIWSSNLVAQKTIKEEVDSEENLEEIKKLENSIHENIVKDLKNCSKVSEKSFTSTGETKITTETQKAFEEWENYIKQKVLDQLRKKMSVYRQRVNITSESNDTQNKARILVPKKTLNEERSPKKNSDEADKTEESMKNDDESELIEITYKRGTSNESENRIQKKKRSNLNLSHLETVFEAEEQPTEVIDVELLKKSGNLTEMRIIEKSNSDNENDVDFPELDRKFSDLNNIESFRDLEQRLQSVFGLCTINLQISFDKCSEARKSSVEDNMDILDDKRIKTHSKCLTNREGEDKSEQLMETQNLETSSSIFSWKVGLEENVTNSNPNRTLPGEIVQLLKPFLMTTEEESIEDGQRTAIVRNKTNTLQKNDLNSSPSRNFKKKINSTTTRKDKAVSVCGSVEESSYVSRDAQEVRYPTNMETTNIKQFQGGLFEEQDKINTQKSRAANLKYSKNVTNSAIEGKNEKIQQLISTGVKKTISRLPVYKGKIRSCQITRNQSSEIINKKKKNESTVCYLDAKEKVDQELNTEDTDLTEKIARTTVYNAGMPKRNQTTDCTMDFETEKNNMMRYIPNATIEKHEMYYLPKKDKTTNCKTEKLQIQTTLNFDSLLEEEHKVGYNINLGKSIATAEKKHSDECLSFSDEEITSKEEESSYERCESLLEIEEETSTESSENDRIDSEEYIDLIPVTMDETKESLEEMEIETALQTTRKNSESTEHSSSFRESEADFFYVDNYNRLPKYIENEKSPSEILRDLEQKIYKLSQNSEKRKTLETNTGIGPQKEALEFVKKKLLKDCSQNFGIFSSKERNESKEDSGTEEERNANLKKVNLPKFIVKSKSKHSGIRFRSRFCSRTSKETNTSRGAVLLANLINSQDKECKSSCICGIAEFGSKRHDSNTYQNQKNEGKANETNISCFQRRKLYWESLKKCPQKQNLNNSNYKYSIKKKEESRKPICSTPKDRHYRCLNKSRPEDPTSSLQPLITPSRVFKKKLTSNSQRKIIKELDKVNTRTFKRDPVIRSIYGNKKIPGKDASKTTFDNSSSFSFPVRHPKSVQEVSLTSYKVAPPNNASHVCQNNYTASNQEIIRRILKERVPTFFAYNFNEYRQYTKNNRYDKRSRRTLRRSYSNNKKILSQNSEFFKKPIQEKNLFKLKNMISDTDSSFITDEYFKFVRDYDGKIEALLDVEFVKRVTKKVGEFLKDFMNSQRTETNVQRKPEVKMLKIMQKNSIPFSESMGNKFEAASVNCKLHESDGNQSKEHSCKKSISNLADIGDQRCNLKIIDCKATDSSSNSASTNSIVSNYIETVNYQKERKNGIEKFKLSNISLNTDIYDSEEYLPFTKDDVEPKRITFVRDSASNNDIIDIRSLHDSESNKSETDEEKKISATRGGEKSTAGIYVIKETSESAELTCKMKNDEKNSIIDDCDQTENIRQHQSDDGASFAPIISDDSNKFNESETNEKMQDQLTSKLATIKSNANYTLKSSEAKKILAEIKKKLEETLKYGITEHFDCGSSDEFLNGDFYFSENEDTELKVSEEIRNDVFFGNENHRSAIDKNNTQESYGKVSPKVLEVNGCSFVLANKEPSVIKEQTKNEKPHEAQMEEDVNHYFNELTEHKCTPSSKEKLNCRQNDFESAVETKTSQSEIKISDTGYPLMEEFLESSDNCRDICSSCSLLSMNVERNEKEITKFKFTSSVKDAQEAIKIEAPSPYDKITKPKYFHKERNFEEHSSTRNSDNELSQRGVGRKKNISMETEKTNLHQVTSFCNLSLNGELYDLEGSDSNIETKEKREITLGEEQFQKAFKYFEFNDTANTRLEFEHANEDFSNSTQSSSDIGKLDYEKPARTKSHNKYDYSAGLRDNNASSSSKFSELKHFMYDGDCSKKSSNVKTVMSATKIYESSQDPMFSSFKVYHEKVTSTEINNSQNETADNSSEEGILSKPKGINRREQTLEEKCNSMSTESHFGSLYNGCDNFASSNELDMHLVNYESNPNILYPDVKSKNITKCESSCSYTLPLEQEKCCFLYKRRNCGAKNRSGLSHTDSQFQTVSNPSPEKLREKSMKNYQKNVMAQGSCSDLIFLKEVANISSKIPSKDSDTAAYPASTSNSSVSAVNRTTDRFFHFTRKKTNRKRNRKFFESDNGNDDYLNQNKHWEEFWRNVETKKQKTVSNNNNAHFSNTKRGAHGRHLKVTLGNTGSVYLSPINYLHDQFVHKEVDKHHPDNTKSLNYYHHVSEKRDNWDINLQTQKINVESVPYIFALANKHPEKFLKAKQSKSCSCLHIFNDFKENRNSVDDSIKENVNFVKEKANNTYALQVEHKIQAKGNPCSSKTLPVEELYHSNIFLNDEYNSKALKLDKPLIQEEFLESMPNKITSYCLKPEKDPLCVEMDSSFSSQNEGSNIFFEETGVDQKLKEMSDILHSNNIFGVRDSDTKSLKDSGHFTLSSDQSFIETETLSKCQGNNKGKVPKISKKYNHECVPGESFTFEPHIVSKNEFSLSLADSSKIVFEAFEVLPANVNTVASDKGEEDLGSKYQNFCIRKPGVKSITYYSVHYKRYPANEGPSGSIVKNESKTRKCSKEPRSIFKAGEEINKDSTFHKERQCGKENWGMVTSTSSPSELDYEQGVNILLKPKLHNSKRRGHSEKKPTLLVVKSVSLMKQGKCKATVNISEKSRRSLKFKINSEFNKTYVKDSSVENRLKSEVLSQKTILANIESCSGEECKNDENKNEKEQPHKLVERRSTSKCEIKRKIATDKSLTKIVRKYFHKKSRERRGEENRTISVEESAHKYQTHSTSDLFEPEVTGFQDNLGKTSKEEVMYERINCRSRNPKEYLRALQKIEKENLKKEVELREVLGEVGEDIEYEYKEKIRKRAVEEEAYEIEKEKNNELDKEEKITKVKEEENLWKDGENEEEEENFERKHDDEVAHFKTKVVDSFERIRNFRHRFFRKRQHLGLPFSFRF